jgi:hypothetical protein
MNNTNTYGLRQPITRTRPEPPKKKPRFVRFIVFLIVLLLIILCAFGAYKLFDNKKTSPKPEFRSAILGYCLDDHHAKNKPGNEVDSWKCNGTSAENWIVSGSHIERIVKKKNYCLSVANSGKQQGDNIVEDSCTSATGQNWQHYLDGYQNPASGLCLDIPNAKTDTQLILDTCNDMTRLSESWTPAYYPGPFADLSDIPCDTGTKGDRVACYAERQWDAWQGTTAIHPALLNDYTDGNTNEEWCADFVSYVYQEAGYPFTNGERNGWDEYNANNIQYMGFTIHPIGSGYVPQPGDVAYFDYPGGHVEIVVKGGNNPTFIYGDAGTIDPATGNGDMSENSFTNDGSAGQVTYYLSPN